MRYHKRFNNISEFTKRKTRWLMSRWNRNWNDWRNMTAWVNLVSEHYQMEVPAVVRNSHAGSGYYLPLVNEIHMSKPSIITLLHEFRHAMQAQGKAGPSFRPYLPEDARGGMEDDARAWSLSLYYAVAPRTLKRLVSEGRVFHTSPADFE